MVHFWLVTVLKQDCALILACLRFVLDRKNLFLFLSVAYVDSACAGVLQMRVHMCEQNSIACLTLE